MTLIKPEDRAKYIEDVISVLEDIIEDATDLTQEQAFGLATAILDLNTLRRKFELKDQGARV